MKNVIKLVYGDEELLGMFIFWVQRIVCWNRLWRKKLFWLRITYDVIYGGKGEHECGFLALLECTANS